SPPLVRRWWHWLVTLSPNQRRAGPSTELAAARSDLGAGPSARTSGPNSAQRFPCLLRAKRAACHANDGPWPPLIGADERRMHGGDSLLGLAAGGTGVGQHVGRDMLLDESPRQPGRRVYADGGDDDDAGDHQPADGAPGHREEGEQRRRPYLAQGA